jgi:hypothetical protein
MFRLYDLTAAYKTVLEMLDDDENNQALQDTLASIDESLDVKIINYAKMIKSVEMPIETLKKEIERLEKKKKNLQTKKDFFKNAIQISMESAGKTKIKDDLFTVSLQKNPPKLKIKNMNDIPEIYMDFTTISYNTTKIKTDLKNGLEVDWAELEQGKSVRIK